MDFTPALVFLGVAALNVGIIVYGRWYDNRIEQVRRRQDQQWIETLRNMGE